MVPLAGSELSLKRCWWCASAAQAIEGMIEH